MTAQVQVNITHTRETFLPGYTIARNGRAERFVVAHVTAEMDDRACAAMLRGVADILDPPAPPLRHMGDWSEAEHS